MSGGPPNTDYNRSKSGWFDAATFQDWFEKIVVPWARKTQQSKVLVGDNLLSHINIDVLQSCQRLKKRFVLLTPNTTQLTQPLDVSFFRPVKDVWRKILTDLKLKQPNLNCVDKCILLQLLTKLLNELADNSQKIIQSGFKACGIYLYNPEEVYKKCQINGLKNE